MVPPITLFLQEYCGRLTYKHHLGTNSQYWLEREYMLKDHAFASGLNCSCSRIGEDEFHSSGTGKHICDIKS